MGSGWTEAIGTDSLPPLARGCLTESETTRGSGAVFGLGLDLLPPALGPRGVLPLVRPAPVMSPWGASGTVSPWFSSL